MTSAPPPSGSRVLAVLRARPLTWFFVLSYAVSWLLWSPIVLLGLPAFSATTHAPSWYLMPGIAIGVTGVAFLMTWVTRGPAGVRRMLQRLVHWRVGLVWFAVAILLIPVTELLVATALGASDALVALTPAALLSYPLAYVSHFWFGPLFEESGWRGFALPRIQARFGPARGTLFLGLLWSAWHFFLYVPVWFASGPVSGVVGIVVFTLTTTAMAFVFTWVSNRTGASLLLVILLHASVDGTATYVQTLADRGLIARETSDTITVMGLLGACVLLAVILLAATRGRLGHAVYQRTAEALDVDPPPAPPPGARRGLAQA